MNDFAVISTFCGQYLVKTGDVINLDKADLTPEEKLSFDVLLLSKKGKTVIGEPFVPKVKVTATVLGDIQAKKINIVKYKAKSRYRRHQGHRQQYTQVRIESI